LAGVEHLLQDRLGDLDKESIDLDLGLDSYYKGEDDEATPDEKEEAHMEAEYGDDTGGPTHPEVEKIINEGDDNYVELASKSKMKQDPAALLAFQKRAKDVARRVKKIQALPLSNPARMLIGDVRVLTTFSSSSDLQEIGKLMEMMGLLNLDGHIVFREYGSYDMEQYPRCRCFH
jgi:hypothetical protein